jgi:putative membrane protein
VPDTIEDEPGGDTETRIDEMKAMTMMGYLDHDGSWMNGYGMLFMVLVWGALIALGVWAVVRTTRANPVGPTSAESPRQILDRRFASGEIDAEQYAAARRVLEGRSIEDASTRS